MQLGCHSPPPRGPVTTREALLTFCRKAEEQQIASLWVSDHVVFPTVNTSNYPGGRGASNAGKGQLPAQGTKYAGPQDQFEEEAETGGMARPSVTCQT